MRRKDGKPKTKAPRNLPQYVAGFRGNGSLSARRAMLGQDPVRVLSLFSGCGGLDLGFLGGFDFLGRRLEPLPFEIVAAYDNSEDAVEAYKLNLGDHSQLADLAAKGVDELPHCEVLLGGFPCQDFSSSGPKVGLAGERGNLYKVLCRYMQAHRPKVVVAENVPHLARLHGGKYLQTILRDFEKTGYRFDVWELYGPDFGLPQSRRRLFLIGVRDDVRGFPRKPAPTHASRHVTVSAALRDLESVSDETVPNQSQYFLASKASKGGGQGDHVNDPAKVAYCIRANARGRIQFHYGLPRRLTVRECARLQSFPDQFVFPYTTQRNLTLIGNAVPPLLGHVVATQISRFLSNSDGVEQAQGQLELSAAV